MSYLPETRVQALISLKVSDPAANIAALKAVTGPQNGALYPVLNDGGGSSVYYRYDSASAAVEALPNIVEPTAPTTGRYFRVGNSTEVSAITPTAASVTLADAQAVPVDTLITFTTTGKTGAVGTFSILRGTTFWVGNIYVGWGTNTVEVLCTLQGQQSTIPTGVTLTGVIVDAATAKLQYTTSAMGGATAALKISTLLVG